MASVVSREYDTRGGRHNHLGSRDEKSTSIKAAHLFKAGANVTRACTTLFYLVYQEQHMMWVHMLDTYPNLASGFHVCDERAHLRKAGFRVPRDPTN